MDNNTENYETLYADLESSISLLQSGDLNLDDAVKEYEKSLKLISKLEKHLELVENKIKKIKNNLK